MKITVSIRFRAATSDHNLGLSEQEAASSARIGGAFERAAVMAFDFFRDLSRLRREPSPYPPSTEP